MKRTDVYVQEYTGHTADGHHGVKDFVRPAADNIADALSDACFYDGCGRLSSAKRFSWVGRDGTLSRITVSEEGGGGNCYVRKLDIETMPPNPPTELIKFLSERGFVPRSK